MNKMVTEVILAVALASMARADDQADTLRKAPSRYANLGEHRIHYKSFGDGKVDIVFIHGFACDMTTWRLQVPAFVGKGRILLIDLPGHGRSDKPKIDYSMALCARAIDAVLKDVGVEKAVLVGHSMGVPVARQFWRLYPDKTTTIVAVDGMIAPLAFSGSGAQAKLLEGPACKEIMLRFADMTFGKLSPELRRSMKAVIGNRASPFRIKSARSFRPRCALARRSKKKSRSGAGPRRQAHAEDAAAAEMAVHGDQATGTVRLRHDYSGQIGTAIELFRDEPPRR